MKTTLKKTLSFLLCFVLLAGIVPAGLLPGSGNAVTAEAAGVSGYSAGAAAQWAIDHLDEYDSVLLGQNYWYTGGDCANFVSHCLYMGGMDMNGYWNISGYMCHWAQPYGDTYAGSFIRCQQLYNYLVKMGAQVIRNPSASQVSIGDVLLYSAEGASRMTHSAIVIDIKNGTPVVAAHSVDGIKYRSDRDNKEWHLGFRSDRTYLMKLYGATCVNQKARTFDVYIAHSGDLKLYASANASSGYHTTFLSGEYAHVYSTVNAGGYTWGYTFRYGAWGWIKLSGFSYQRHINAVQVSHKFGAWKTVRKATCLQDGLEQRVCSRCGYTEDRTTTCGHVTLVHATCTTPGYCSVCGMQTEDALGHNFEIDNARYIEPTCTEDGFGAYTCTRCGAHDDHTLPALGHDYVAMPTAPTCVQDGISTLVCSRCSDTLVVYTDEDNTWSEWTETTPAEMGLGGDRVQSKTQYRSSDYETQTSYATSISGWTRGDFTLVKSSSGSIDYGTSWPAGFNTSHSLYSQYHKSKTSASETETSKRVINSDNVLGYIYWHWCRGLTDGPTNHIIYGEKHANDKGEKWYTFHAFYSTTDYELRTFPGTGHGDAYVASRSDVCIDSYYWGRINVNKQSYTDYKKLYTYSRWTDYSAWQDAEITATDTERVQTRTLYRYDLAALGHDFSTTTEKQFLTQPHLLSSDELNGDCYAIGTVCSRCGAVAPDSTVFPHDVPVFETEPEAYALITAETDPVQVYRTYCRCGCGCWYDVSVNTCEWTETVIAPTCTEVGYTLHTCTAHGETFTTDEIPALGHDMSGEWVITKNPTCTEAGEMECLCARYDVCGHKETQEIPPLWHTMTAFEAKEPTCTED
ncbi:MAG: amidase domain-containing protein, partial [Clostridia bacterium]|nr:amidase domain-containing protein [Clostridia bacterium]